MPNSNDLGIVELTRPLSSPLLESTEGRICKSSATEYRPRFPFGPVYYREDSSGVKDDSWNHVLEKTSGHASVTKEIYISVLGKVEIEARSRYADSMDGWTRPEFLLMMVVDGCLFLQLMIGLLGGVDLLKYPEDHTIFSSRGVKKVRRRCIKSMLLPGNQIPLLVLRLLMKQSFFQSVISSKQWEEPSDSLERMLYRLLLVPALTHSDSNSATCWWPALKKCPGTARNTHDLRVLQSTDLLQGLYLQVLGESRDSTEGGGGAGEKEEENEKDDEEVVEEDEDEEEDIESGTVRVRRNSHRSFKSATELKELGIRVKSDKRMGSRRIRFKAKPFGVLYLPPIKVDDSTKLIFKYLNDYDISHHSNPSKRHVCAYTLLMRDLCRTTEDAQLLVRAGVIEVDIRLTEDLPGFFDLMAYKHSSGDQFCFLRQQVAYYSPIPWAVVGGWLGFLAFLTFVLTFVQTTYTMRDSKHS